MYIMVTKMIPKCYSLFQSYKETNYKETNQYSTGFLFLLDAFRNPCAVLSQ